MYLNLLHTSLCACLKATVNLLFCFLQIEALRLMTCRLDEFEVCCEKIPNNEI